MPEAGRLIWSWFGALNGSRTYHMSGPNPISYAEIEAWARLHGWSLSQRHIDAIRALDDAWLDHVQAKQANRDGGNTLPVRQGRR